MAPAASTSSSASTSAHNQWEHLTFVEVLEDLSSRFIVNLPKEELQSIQRICFQVEQAHWFYEDFLRPMNASLPSLNLRRFSIYILQTASLEVPLIRQYVSSDQSQDDANRVQDWQALGQASYGLEAAFDEFLKYKTRVPVCGVILVSQDWKSCLLVKGWKSSAAWGFPKGKINQSESHRDCAVRETFEETGFDCSHLLPPDSPHWFELNVRTQKIRLYVVPDVSQDTVFETQTRKEISKIDWFKMSDLPTWRQGGGGGGLASANAGAKFYLVTPFVGKLKQWVKENKKKHPKAAISSNATTADAATATKTPNTTAVSSIQSGSAPAGPLFVDAASAWPLAQQSTPAAQPSVQRKDDSAMLLSMLNGGAVDLNRSHAQSGASPLPAPRPQKPSTQTIDRFDAINGHTTGTTTSSTPHHDAEAERAKKRDALLSQLMTGSTDSTHSSASVQSQSSSGQALLSTLMSSAGSKQSPQPAHMTNGQPASPDKGRAGLLAMLNAGPLSSRGSMPPPQQYPSMPPNPPFPPSPQYRREQYPSFAPHPYAQPPPPPPHSHLQFPHPPHQPFANGPPTPHQQQPFYGQPPPMPTMHMASPHAPPPPPVPAAPATGNSNKSNDGLLALLNGRG